MTKTTKKSVKINSNFPTNFLKDFELGSSSTHPEYDYFWIFNKKALQRFHLPITYMELNGHEDKIHYGKKQQVHDYIYENYYMNNKCKYYVTTELQQVKTPFKALLVEQDGAEKIFYKLDVCVIRSKDHQVFDIEIDGPEHGTDKRMLKDAMRDKLLNFRYGIYTLRLDKFDEINFKKIDKFLKQDAMPYTRNRKTRGKPYVKNPDY